jgi:hypothetical protein
MATDSKQVGEKRSFWKKFKWFIQQYDGVWSVPLAFFAFYFVGLALTSLFGYGTGFYDPAFIQPLFLAGAVVIGATNMATVGIYFTFRGLFRYLYGFRNKEGIFENQSKTDWKELKVWQRFIVAFFSFFFFVVAIITVYLKMV